jgi:voltage-gated potassium channel
MADKSPNQAGSVINEETTLEERYEALTQLESWLEGPVMVLGFAWLVLLVIELVWGLNPVLEALVFVIWTVFLLDFAVRFILAPNKLAYLKSNVLTILSLLLPALRVLRIGPLIRVAVLSRTARSLRLVKVVGSLNRGMRALKASMARRGFGYVILLTLLVILVGSAGIFAFEREIPERGGIRDLGDALWFTTMILTTLGSEYWPRTAEGRVLTLLLSVYGFAILGYVTATLATFFIGREAENEDTELVGMKSVAALRAEIEALREEVRSALEKKAGLDS